MIFEWIHRYVNRKFIISMSVGGAWSKWGIPRTGYLVPGRDGPGAWPNGESSWETVAAAAVAAVTSSGGLPPPDPPPGGHGLWFDSLSMMQYDPVWFNIRPPIIGGQCLWFSSIQYDAIWSSISRIIGSQNGSWSSISRITGSQNWLFSSISRILRY